MRFLATLRRATFYISLSKGSAIGKLLNVTLLAYASDEKLYSTRAKFPNQAKKIELATKKNSRSSQQSPCWGKGLNAVNPKYPLYS